MSSFSSILSKGVISNLGRYPSTSGGIQQLLVSAAYTPAALPGGRGIVLNQLSSIQFVESLEYDFQRFALSSRESFLVAISEKKEFGSLGWPLLKFYYSSFFAAHAIMRSRGAGLIKLDRKHVEHLNSVAQVYDSAIPNLSPGMYFFELKSNPQNSGQQISMVLRPDLGGSGVHEGFWSMFCEFLKNEAAKNVREGEIDSAKFLAYTSDLVDAIKSGQGSGVWLSSVRNEINYQHKYDLWLPYKRSSEGYKTLSNVEVPSIDLARLDVSKDRKPMQAFLSVTCYISTLSFSIFEFIAKRSKSGGTFGQKWQKINSLMGI